ncbi:Arc family DNA-binding protein [Acinetobacter radioresistens]|uniref:Arc family DNA-binding protein n=1 Tax=Acinetobacter radioresistens TaxID=40216 RepID=UPI0021CD9F2B|nr:Arc family DNA-binding protein [Acinetobacter radioresistens]MCU4500873.1 Arc family DNA-binding protein [Acinetobacter radioresistens]MCU4517794.1 Arc family DNA-binding protein [Acinetobacter radioresistens]
MTASSGSLTTQYNLRWSEDLKEKVVDASKENSRSINQEIVTRLEQSFSLTGEKPIVNKKIDVCLQILPTPNFDLEEDEYQSLILQFDPAQIPMKGDVLEIEDLGGNINTFEVNKRVVSISKTGNISFTLVLQRPTDW